MSSATPEHSSDPSVNEEQEADFVAFHSRIDLLNKQDAEYKAIYAWRKDHSFAGVVVPKTIAEKTIKNHFKSGAYRYNSSADCIEILKKSTTKDTQCKQSNVGTSNVSSMSDLAELSETATYETKSVSNSEWKTFISKVAAVQLIEALHIDCHHGSRQETRIRVEKSKFYRNGIFSMVNEYFANGSRCAICANIVITH